MTTEIAEIHVLSDHGRRYVPGFQPFDASALLEGAPFDS